MSTLLLFQVEISIKFSKYHLLAFILSMFTDKYKQQNSVADWIGNKRDNKILFWGEGGGGGY